MAWFKVDDGFATSPKVLSIPRSERLAAVGLWVIAGTWCAKHLTDGYVPAYMIEEWGADVSHGTALVTARLWVEEDAGYRFHDWGAYQPSREAVESHRARERQRKEEWRKKKAGISGESPQGVTPSVPAGQDEVSQRPSALPDPTHPDPTRPLVKREGAAKRGTRIPEPFIVTAEMRQWAAAEVPGLDVDGCTRRFVDYWRAESGAKATKKDWVATWRNWLRRDHDQRKTGSRPSPSDRALATIALGRDDRAVGA